MRALPLFASALLLAGCINGDFATNDAGVPVQDMANPRVYDIAGLDLYGAYNCAGLNACERACTTKACVFMCRNMATPSAVDKDNALQSCFTQQCPTTTGEVCAPDMNGMVSMACMICLANTYIPNGQSCSPARNPSECHQCVAQANACNSDM